MRRLVLAEFRKLATTRLWLWMLLACMALTALLASLAIAFDGSSDNATPPLSSAAGQRTLFSVGTGAGPLVAVLAAIGLAREFRHKTSTATSLATPQRSRVVLAKLETYAIVGAAYGTSCLAVTAAIAYPWLAAKHSGVVLAGKAGTMISVVAALAVYGLIGVGLAALLRDQIATVVGLLVYLFVVEPIITRVPAFESWSNYLRGAAARRSLTSRKTTRSSSRHGPAVSSSPATALDSPSPEP